MKKILSVILILAMLLGALGTVSFAASSSFTDITDDATATAVEVLRLMGIVDGSGNGKFNPTGTFNRGEFAKLSVSAMYSDASFAKYGNMTIFPDVKGGDWYGPYINMAARELKIITGCPDGYFHPERTISVGEAVTILLRLIGFKDDDIGGVWPYGHFDFAKNVGLLNGINASSATQTITRADAAKLFVNTINVDSANNGTTFKLSGETVLLSIDSRAKTLKTTDGSYRTGRSISGNSMIGKAGYVVLDKNGAALSFIPKSAIASSYDQAIVVKSSGDATTLNALAGRTDYKIIKNGAVVTIDEIKNGDVAVYDKENNTIVVCDTRVSVLYGSCEGTPSEPISITALGGNIFEVLPSAISTIKNFKPGSHMSLYLTAAGQIAAVGGTTYTDYYNNAVFIVSPEGKASMVCGTDVIDYGITVDKEAYWGQAVRLNYEYEDKFSWGLLSGNSYGTLNVFEKKLGSKKIASNAIIFENGIRTSLSELSTKSVTYASTNSSGEIDLIVCFDMLSGNFVPGKATLDSSNNLKFTGSNGVTGTIEDVSLKLEGYYIVNYVQNRLRNPKQLNLLRSVSKTDFTSDKMVTVNNQIMTLYKNAGFFNKDSGEWTTYEVAMAYGSSYTLYGVDGTVYLVVYTY